MTSLRLDKWLWFARFAKTRSRAAKLCTAGCIIIGGMTILKPGHLVRVGDQLTLRVGRVARRIEILALGERRGPASDARLLYTETGPPIPVAERDELWVSLFDEAGNEITSNRSLSR